MDSKLKDLLVRVCDKLDLELRNDCDEMDPTRADRGYEQTNRLMAMVDPVAYRLIQELNEHLSEDCEE